MDDPLSYTGFPYIANIPLVIANSGIIGYSVATVILILLSAAMSAAEVAFFSITRKEIDELNDGLRKRVLKAIESPKKLLATVLIANNAANLSVVIISGFIVEALIPANASELVEFLVQIIAVTFVILLFAEVMPKIYATQYPKQIVKLMSLPMIFLNRALSWLSTPLMWSSSFFDKKIKKYGASLSAGDLEAVIDLTNDETVSDEEKKIWKGIVEFGTISVKETMKPRMDVVAIDINSSFREVMNVVLQAGYSRLPVYNGSFDKIEGVLYIKDLLPYIDKEENFEWQTLLRPTYFVPENKKIDDLLKEFQEKKMHLAIVVDEYGGSAGIVTLEDVIEEIVGEINDEFDDEEIIYSKLDEHNFVFEGKTPLVQMCRIIDIEYEDIEEHAGDADTIAGLLLQLTGSLPEKDQIIESGFLRFKVESVDKRRIKRVKVTKTPVVDEKQEEA